MRHGIKKIKFGFGKDSNKMLLRKLVNNFVTKGRIETTLTKAKVLKPLVEKVVEKAKENNQANKNWLLSFTGNQQVVNTLFSQVGPVLKDKVGGYVRIIRLGQRATDGAETAKVEWVYPVIYEEKAKKSELKKVEKTVKAKESKKEEAKK